MTSQAAKPSALTTFGKHPYWQSAKEEQRDDYKDRLPTFFATLTRQSESLKGKRILEVVK